MLKFATLPSLTLLAVLASCSEPEPTREEAADSQPHTAQAVPNSSAKKLAAVDPALLTPNGWGPLTIGMSLQEVIQVAGPDAQPDQVGGPEPEACDQFHPARTPQNLYVMIERGVLTNISVTNDSKIKTDAGLSLGASQEDVTNAYGDAITITPHKYVEAPAAYMTAWTTDLPDMTYVENPDARGIRYEIGSSGTVDKITVGGPSIQYVEGCL